MFSSTIVSRERLEALTVFRVTVVTVILIFALIFDSESISKLTEARSTTLLILIIATYLLSILYSLVIRQMTNVTPLAVVQVTMDLIIAGVLIGITGGLASSFIFLFHLNIVNTTSIAGTKIGMFIALITALVLVVFGLIEMGYLYEFFPDGEVPVTSTDLWFRVSVMSGAGFMLAFLSGYLSDSLGQVKSQLAEHRETALKQQALNEYILDGISSGVTTVDENDNIIFFNNAAVQITGMKKEFALGLSLQRAFPEIGKILADLDVSNWMPLTSKRYEAKYQTDTQELHLGFSVSPLDIGTDRKGAIIIFQNLTDVRQMEMMIRRNKHLAAVGELAASIAHEIRNPLAAISGSVEMLEEESSASSETQMLHGIVVREVDRLNLLVSDFLNYSRPRPLEIESFNLDTLIHDFLLLVGNKRNNITIKLDGLQPGQMLTADPEVLKQILWNLVNNGADAMGGRGTIVLGLRQSDTHLWIYVEDDGPGVPLKDREKIFEPFFTSKEKGTGLGLATTFRLIEEHRGEIDISDAQTLSGARFEFNLGTR